MRVCPKCNKARRVVPVIEKDKKTKKHWVITKCMVCGFNFDLEEFTDETAARKKVDFFKRRLGNVDD